MLHFSTGCGGGYSTVNASTESPILLFIFPCPPAQMTMYCLPRISYVIGVDCALAGSSEVNTSLPVSASNTCRLGSNAAAEKINPPAVASGPPKLGEPG